MTLGALVELGASSTELESLLRDLPLADWSVEFAKTNGGHGIFGTGVRVSCDRDDDHHHTRYEDIVRLISDSGLNDRVKQSASSIFAVIAAAEAKVHNCDVKDVSFHEVGAIDSIVDIIGVSIALDLLDIDTVSATPVPLGHGFVKSQHGRIPVPAPATLECLAGVPCYDSGLDVELVTPTGAGILAGLVSSFTRFPAMTVERVGYGAGTRKHADRPNVLRAVLGQTAAWLSVAEEQVWEIQANIDDQTPEEIAYVLSALRDNRACDAWTAPISMKKGRAGHLLACLCHPHDLAELSRIILTETTTLGIRLSRKTRLVLDRELVSVKTGFGQIQVKVGRNADGQVWNVAVEADDCEAAARRHGVPLKQVRQDAMVAALKVIQLEN